MPGVKAGISASVYNHLHHIQHPLPQQLHRILKMMATGGTPIPVDVAPIIATSTSGASILLGAAKIGNGCHMFGELAI
jgi:hypothetical protein